ncbi:MAG: hypothetical protein FJ288_03375 [Planctomycetes bacterium]|nr:hypothetical protein [Planctomycetota bacterium]
MFTRTPPKPDLYRVTGRVIDAPTKQGLGGVRLLLRAAIPTDLGPRTLAAHGYTSATGTYSVELSEGFDVLRTAMGIRLEASKRGYLPVMVDLPPPAPGQKAYPVPDIVLAPGDLPPATVAPPGVPVPGLAPAPGTGPRVIVPRIGPQPKRPTPSAIPWKP